MCFKTDQPCAGSAGRSFRRQPVAFKRPEVEVEVEVEDFLFLL